MCVCVRVILVWSDPFHVAFILGESDSPMCVCNNTYEEFFLLYSSFSQTLFYCDLPIKYYSSMNDWP